MKLSKANRASRIGLSIIIVNYNAEPFLEKCLKSIYEKTHGIDFEVIVINNNSNNIGNYGKNGFSNIKWIHNQKNVGFSFANNQGIKICEGKYIVLLNPDTEILNNSFKIMLEFLENNLKVGILGPKVLERDGETVQLSCRQFPSIATSVFNRHSVLTRLFPQNKWSREYLLTDWDHNDLNEIDWVSGCCMMLRRSMLDEIGMLDESFFMYNEDVDICYRAKMSGWQVMYLPDALIKHYIGGSSKTVNRKMVIERHKSMWKFYKKHYSKDIFFDSITFTAIFFRSFLKIIFPDNTNHLIKNRKNYKKQ